MKLNEHTNFWSDIRLFFSYQARNLLNILYGFEKQLRPQPLVAIIKRNGSIFEGRYVVYFEVTLLGDNPVILEEFGTVANKEINPLPRFQKELEVISENYRYYVEIRQRFQNIEDARDFWVSRGAATYWY